LNNRSRGEELKLNSLANNAIISISLIALITLCGCQEEQTRID